MYGILISTQMMPSTWIDLTAEKGFIAILLVVFVGYFIRRSKNDDKRVEEAYKTAQENMDVQNRAVREREDYLLAESAKREEIIRCEAERREKLIRAEAEKRESILMASQDRMLETLDNIAISLNRMEQSMVKQEQWMDEMGRSMVKQEQRMDAMERMIEDGSDKGNGS